MSQITGSFSLDDSEHTMSLLAAQLERFVNDWDASTRPPDLAKYLPETGEIRRLTLVEQRESSLVARWPKEESTFEVPAPILTEAETESLQQELLRLFEL